MICPKCKCGNAYQGLLGLPECVNVHCDYFSPKQLDAFLKEIEIECRDAPPEQSNQELAREITKPGIGRYNSQLDFSWDPPDPSQD